MLPILHLHFFWRKRKECQRRRRCAVRRSKSLRQGCAWHAPRMRLGCAKDVLKHGARWHRPAHRLASPNAFHAFHAFQCFHALHSFRLIRKKRVLSCNPLGNGPRPGSEKGVTALKQVTAACTPFPSCVDQSGQAIRRKSFGCNILPIRLESDPWRAKCRAG